MKVSFLTETPYNGKWPENFRNARTEIAWQIALDSEHFNIANFTSVKNYDHVFIIFPKGEVYLNAVGSRLSAQINPVSNLLKENIIQILKENGNKKIHYIQEGPHWLWNDYEIEDQIYFYNFLAQCDSIFAHNESDVSYYKGLFPNKQINTIPTLMVEQLIKDITPVKNDKTIIGGNFARWYGGFESYLVAQEFGTPILAQTSHAKRDNEEAIENLQHLPRLIWIDWMKELSTYKYAVHLMPTVAAGTFSLNCAYFGIPCIGNEKVDTQRICHPLLSVNVSDVESARNLAIKLKYDTDFYNECSLVAKENYYKNYGIDIWKQKILNVL